MYSIRIGILLSACAQQFIISCSSFCWLSLMALAVPLPHHLLYVQRPQNNGSCMRMKHPEYIISSLYTYVGHWVIRIIANLLRYYHYGIIYYFTIRTITEYWSDMKPHESSEWFTTAQRSSMKAPWRSWWRWRRRGRWRWRWRGSLRWRWRWWRSMTMTTTNDDDDNDDGDDDYGKLYFYDGWRSMTVTRTINDVDRSWNSHEMFESERCSLVEVVHANSHLDRLLLFTLENHMKTNSGENNFKLKFTSPSVEWVNHEKIHVSICRMINHEKIHVSICRMSES